MSDFDLGKGAIQHLSVVDSTNDEAFRQLKQHQRILLWSTEQTKGRGSRGRSWVSPPGAGLAISLGIQCHPYPHPAKFCYPLFAGIWLHKALSQVLPQVRFDLKWPNDLLLDGRKLAGILCESRLEGDRALIVIGIGLNLHDDPALRPLEKPYATLAELPLAVTCEAILEALALSFGPLMGQLQHEGLHQAWLDRCGLALGQRLQIRLDGETLIGRFDGLSQDGGLRLRLEDKSLKVISQAVEDCLFLTEESCSLP